MGKTYGDYLSHGAMSTTLTSIGTIATNWVIIIKQMNFANRSTIASKIEVTFDYASTSVAFIPYSLSIPAGDVLYRENLNLPVEAGTGYSLRAESTAVDYLIWGIGEHTST